MSVVQDGSVNPGDDDDVCIIVRDVYNFAKIAGHFTDTP